MPSGIASEIARRLAENAEAVCRQYLSRGRRSGSYWVVGDIANTPGRSLFVRLTGHATGIGAAGKWTDAATGAHGDLLDLIAQCRGLAHLRDVLDEARAFLALPAPQTAPKDHSPSVTARTPDGTDASRIRSARRLFAMAKPVLGTVAESYLRSRALFDLADIATLRFHPRCYYQPDSGLRQSRPALLSPVTDLNGGLTGIHRTWLDPAGGGKALIDTPRRAIGLLLGNAVRFGAVSDILAAGEGLETVLSLRRALPMLPAAAALSAAHLAALRFPASLRFLYILRETDGAGSNAASTLTERARAAGFEARTLVTRRKDLNDDLQQFGLTAVRADLTAQLDPRHVSRLVDALP